ncbi:hypothetical protein ADUPG1_006659, partial [Aduncisulcus paluster]
MIIQIGHTRIGIVRHNLINSITQDAVFPHDLHLDTEKDDDEDDATLLDLFGEDSEGSDGKEEEEEVRGRGKGRGRGRGRGGGKYDLESILGSASITGSSKTSSSSRKKSKNSTKHHRSSKPSKKQADLLDIKAEAEKNKMVDVSAMISLMDAEEEQSGLGDTSVRCVSPGGTVISSKHQRKERRRGGGRGRGRGGGKYDLESILGSASITGSSKTSSSSRKKSKNSTKHHRSSKPSKKQADLLDIKA